MLTLNQSDPPAANPLVTMIVLCYNQARFVVETLESVKAQTYKNTELIVIDDCSTDDSVAVIERWLTENEIRCTFIPHKTNQGICKSLNEALRLTTGKYISMIAGDDIWLPDKIERQVAIMESQPESVGVLYSDAFTIDENGQPLANMYIAAHHFGHEVPPPSNFNALLDGNFIPGMATLIRRSCYNTVGVYDEDMPTEDWDMWLRIARHYPYFYSPGPTAKYRVHRDSFSHDGIQMAVGTIKLLSKQIKLAGLDEQQMARVINNIDTQSRLLPELHLQEANRARLNGDRPAAARHLTECVRSGWFRRLPREVALWTSLAVYVLLGIRRLRWWRAVNPQGR